MIYLARSFVHPKGTRLRVCVSVRVCSVQCFECGCVCVLSLLNFRWALIEVSGADKEVVMEFDVYIVLMCSDVTVGYM